MPLATLGFLLDVRDDVRVDRKLDNCAEDEGVGGQRRGRARKDVMAAGTAVAAPEEDAFLAALAAAFLAAFSAFSARTFFILAICSGVLPSNALSSSAAAGGAAAAAGGAGTAFAAASFAARAHA